MLYADKMFHVIGINGFKFQTQCFYTLTGAQVFIDRYPSLTSEQVYIVHGRLLKTEVENRPRLKIMLDTGPDM
jgi:hypothetical protein